MDYERMTGALKAAWDALEEYPARGYALRARINLVQEKILEVYTQLAEARKKSEQGDPACAENKPDKE